MIFNSQGDAKLRQYINGQTITPGDTAITLPKGAQLLGDVIIEAADTEAAYEEGYNAGYNEGYAAGYEAAAPYNKKLQYIQSSGTQWINTRIYPSRNLKTYIKFKVNTLHNAVLGSAWNTTGYFLYVWDGTTLGFQSGGTETAISGYLSGEINEVTAASSRVICNEQITDIAYNSAYTNAYPINIFRVGSGENSGFNAKMNLYALKMYDGDTLVRDFIPVLDLNGVACLYDKVNKQFYYNAGSGSFSYAE